MSQFSKKLKDANKLWNAAKTRVAEGGQRYAEFDDGRYMMRITSAKMGESQSSGRLQITWTFKFEDGQYDGQTKLDFSGLETENNLYYMGLRMKQLGYEIPESLDEVEDILADVGKTKPLCKVNLKTKGDYQNVYIDKVFASGIEESGEEPEDDDTPEEAPAAPAPKPKGKGKAAKPAPEPEPEVEEDEDEDAVEEDDDTVEEEEVEEEDDEAEADDEVELTVGMSVSVETSKGTVSGEVLEILEAEGKARIKTADGKTLRVPVDKIIVEEAVPEEPKKAPAKKGKK